MRLNFLPIFEKGAIVNEGRQTSFSENQGVERMSYLGVYDRTIFYNPASKYCIISVKTSDQSIPQQARSAYKHRDHLIRFVAVGYELPRTDKVSMRLDGEWQNGKHGYQLQVQQCEEIVPQTKAGVQGYLSSCLVGVGEKTAELIVGRFGADALKVLENEPERLLEIRGITPAKLEDIKSSYAESRCLRDLMLLLSPFQVTPAAATKIYEHFGAKSVDILRSNPYKLCQVSGFGFKRVDAIVRKGDTPMNSPMRIHGAIYAALDAQRSENGHLYLETDALRKTALQLLNDKLPLPQMRVTPGEIENVLENMILQGEVVSSSGNIYPLPCFTREDETARQIARLISEPPQHFDVVSALEHIRSSMGIPLSQRQSEAVYMAFRHNLSIVTGPPGTGKTTILRAIIEVFKHLFPESKIMLAAPTGRASRRMVESTGVEAKTLHSLLGLVGEDMDYGKGVYIGLPMAGQFSITAVGSTILQSAVNSLGSGVVAAVTAAGKVQIMLSQPMETMGITMATYCGQNYGAGQTARIREGMHKSLILVLAYSVIGFFIAAFAGQYIALLFLDADETVILDHVRQFLFVNGLFYPVLAILFVLRNSLQGLGFSVPAMAAGLCELVARTVVAFGFVTVFGYNAVCFANPSAWVAAVLLLIPLYFWGMRRLRRDWAVYDRLKRDMEEKN